MLDFDDETTNENRHGCSAVVTLMILLGIILGFVVRALVPIVKEWITWLVK